MSTYEDVVMPEQTGQKTGITLRLDYEDRCAVHTVRALSDQATQAGAIMHVVREYPALLTRIEQLESQAGLAEVQRKARALLDAIDVFDVSRADVDKARRELEEVLK